MVDGRKHVQHIRSTWSRIAQRGWAGRDSRMPSRSSAANAQLLVLARKQRLIWACRDTPFLRMRPGCQRRRTSRSPGVDDYGLRSRGGVAAPPCWYAPVRGEISRCGGLGAIAGAAWDGVAAVVGEMRWAYFTERLEVSGCAVGLRIVSRQSGTRRSRTAVGSAWPGRDRSGTEREEPVRRTTVRYGTTRRRSSGYHKFRR